MQNHADYDVEANPYEDHHLEGQWYGPPQDGVEPATAAQEKVTNIADAFGLILEWCWLSRRNKRNPKTAFIRFASLCCTVRPELLDDKNYEQIGAELGVSKEVISRYSLEFQDTFKVHFRRSWSQTSRRQYARKRFSEAQQHHIT